jgi:hypothetical protein
MARFPQDRASPCNGVLNDSLWNFDGEQAQVFATSLAMSTYAQRGGPYRTRLGGILTVSCHGTV